MNEKKYNVPPVVIYILMGIFAIMIFLPPIAKALLPKEEVKPPVTKKEVASLNCNRVLQNSTYTSQRVSLVYEAEEITKLTYIYAKGKVTVPNDPVLLEINSLSLVEGADLTDDETQLKIVFPKEVAQNLVANETPSNQGGQQETVPQPNPAQPAAPVTEPETTVDTTIEGQQTYFESLGYTCQVLRA